MSYAITDPSILARLDPPRPCASYQPRNSPPKRQLGRRGRGSDPPSYLLVFRLLGHLLSTMILHAAIFTSTWALGFCCAWLNHISPLSEETSVLVSKVELAILYGDCALLGFFWLIGAWRLITETMR